MPARERKKNQRKRGDWGGGWGIEEATVTCNECKYLKAEIFRLFKLTVPSQEGFGSARKKRQNENSCTVDTQKEQRSHSVGSVTRCLRFLHHIGKSLIRNFYIFVVILNG